MIRWDFESPLFIDESINSLTEKLNEDKTDFIDVPVEKWETIAKIWIMNNPVYINNIDEVIKMHKKAALKLIEDYSISWERKYNII